MQSALYAGTIFTSAFLLFLIQPIASKHILPWFGGSAAVWAVSLSFFQVLLLGGYTYADWTTRRLTARIQVLLHIALLAIGWLTLQVLANARWKPTGHEDPTLHILLTLATSIGLPYFLLSSTGPIVQSWVARSDSDARVYRLFSLSNLASLAGLLAYPFIIEPVTSLTQQAMGWSVMYGVFTLFCMAAGWQFQKRMQSTAHASHIRLDAPKSQPTPTTTPAHAGAVVDAPGRRQYVLWFVLSGVASWLLVATTNHLTRDVASVPFLWIVPLVLYLLSFVLCFESDRWYRRHWMQLLTVLCVTLLCATLVPFGNHAMKALNITNRLPWLVAAFSGALFLQCMFLHGELALRRPAREHLTRFYLTLALGGAAGGLVVSLMAPRLLSGYYEFGSAQVLVSVLALTILRRMPLIRVVAVFVVLGASALLALRVAFDIRQTRVMERNFYGTLSTRDRDTATPAKAWRVLEHGVISHGAQFLAPERRMEPTTYYAPESGLGRAIEATRHEEHHIGVIGLGVATIAAYGRVGDKYRFYEIDPQVIDIAKSEFTFLKQSQARIDIVLGDARLALEREPAQNFDVLVVDAFSGDSVPTHLLTREAMAVYLRHLSQHGILALHVSNLYLDLAPVVAKVAQQAGLSSVQVVRRGAEGNISQMPSHWVLVAREAATLQHPSIGAAAKSILIKPDVKAWSDDHNNLLSLLKTKGK